MKKIKAFLPAIFYALSFLVLVIIKPLTGAEIVAFPWKTLSYIFILLLLEEGLRKEKIALPLFRLLNSIRSTPFLFFVLLSSAFILSLFLFDFYTVLILVPFTITLLMAANKNSYIPVTVALITLISTITSLFTPFSTANLYLFLEGDTAYSSYMSTLLPPFFISLLVIIAEALIVYRKTKGDEIYLHIENEEYWDKDRKGIRILYIAFFLVALFGRRFNTIDLLLVIAASFLFLDRSIFRKINWSSFITLFLIMLSSYTLGKTITATKLSLFFSSLVFTRLGTEVAAASAVDSVKASLLSTVVSFSFAFIYALKETKEKKAFAKDYLLLMLPHAVVYAVFAFIL